MLPVTAVIPNWNRRDLLARVLEQLAGQCYAPVERIVVDNGSDDGSAEAAEALGARVIRLPSNQGFAAAVNRGIGECRTEGIAILNNDLELERDWLQRLAAALEDGRKWFAAGKALNHSRRDEIDGTFDLVCRGACAWRAGNGRMDGPEWQGASTVRFAPFTAALFRAELFRRVGLLDQRFESYLEDVDFGLRCARMGYEGVFVPEARVYHLASATLGRWHPATTRRISRNQVLLVAKHFPAGWPARLGWPVAVAQALWCILAARHGAGPAALRGKLEGWRRFGEFRRAAAEERRGPEVFPVERILLESERELQELQRRHGFDHYWRWYFTLT